MNTNDPLLDGALSRLLKESRSTPPLPPGFQNGVWRRIERAGATSDQADWLGSLLSSILRPKFVLGGLASLMVLGATVGVIDGINAGKQAAEIRYVASVSPLSTQP